MVRIPSRDRLGLIFLGSENKFKILASPFIEWAVDGPLSKSYEANLREEFLKYKALGTDEWLLFRKAYLAKDSLKLIRKQIEDLLSRIKEYSEYDRSTQPDRCEPVTFLLAARNWIPSSVISASHYGFRIECLPPRDPKKKGKVERMSPYARRLFEAFNCEEFIIERAQRYIDEKSVIANERRHGTTDLKPVEVFLTAEVDQLRALPVLGYEKEEIAYPIVRKDGFVRFANKYYAVSDEHIGKEAVVLGSKSRMVAAFFSFCFWL